MLGKLLFVTLLAAGAAGGELGADAAQGAASAPTGPVLKVAFVYVSPVGQAGWTYQHDVGRADLETFLGPRVKTTVVESVPEGADAERVMRDLASQGHQLIFATSFGYQEPALRVAAEFPDVKFAVAGGYKRAPNVATYSARHYEGRYLAGMLAGYHSIKGVAGYVAGFPVPEVVQGINAFTLGMRSVNPKAQVKVIWLDTWFDPAREREAALTLVRQGADVLTNHTASTAVAQLAEEQKVDLLAYQSDMRAVAPHAQLGAVTQHWGPYYVRTSKALIDGRWQPLPHMGGLKDAMVGMDALASRLKPEARRAGLQKEDEIRSGRFRIFSGRLVDNTGRERQPEGATMSDEQIAKMDWLAQGVVGSLPAAR
ncbi:BMP family ABC transporter substrate-binding protein [Ideonella sp. YS5]|uniref:BMP family ABC transporter substrate-binding protein n=1 Tax=Ideonella sp. YS5 TaxID=3453714 RepID=UPI003EED42C0